MESPVLTAEGLRTVIERLWNEQPRVCTHIAPPDPDGYVWRLAFDPDKVVRITGCAALCGAVLGLEPDE